MNRKMNTGEIIKVGVILFLITAVLAGLLAFVNAMTAPLIEQNAIAAEQEAMKTVMPDASSFKEVELNLKDLLPDQMDELLNLATENDGEISKMFIALDANGETIGACVITVTTGYDVGIQTVTGVDKNLTVTGVDIISMNETPGLGANADNPEFRAQYEGKSGEIKVVKTAAGDDSIQAIAGATKSSNGVTRGVNLALNVAKILLEGGNE